MEGSVVEEGSFRRVAGNGLLADLVGLTGEFGPELFKRRLFGGRAMQRNLALQRAGKFVVCVGGVAEQALAAGQGDANGRQRRAMRLPCDP